MMISCIIRAGGMPSNSALEACKPEMTDEVLNRDMKLYKAAFNMLCLTN